MRRNQGGMNKIKPKIRNLISHGTPAVSDACVHPHTGKEHSGEAIQVLTSLEVDLGLGSIAMGSTNRFLSR
jgi:hypothetical protein